MSAPLEALEQRLGTRFTDRGLLLRALTHPSWTEENGGENYQRLEFLGDSVLGFIVADLMYARFPDKAEGELTRMKWALVCGTALASIGRDLQLDEHLLVGRGAAVDKARDSVLEACFEAVIGAVFLDAGLTAARELVLRSLGQRLDDDALSAAAVRNPKGDLQELAQSKGLGLPSYRIVSSEGPVHETVFVAEVTFGDEPIGRGTGTSKQAAERAAALSALDSLA
jgi:ribonuclease-3